MSLIKYGYIFLFLTQTFTSKAQLKYYAEPIKINLSISGSFGELRSDHFHTGLDFRTEQKTGIPVFSCAEGYVSRITVSPTGFGKALYIDHPNHTTTVYGHLDKFREDLEEYVISEQYKLQSFQVDLKIPSGKFKVSDHQQIAWSGNSGSSEGPHLHFEIRDTPSQDALNPVRIAQFIIKDNKPPRIRSVQIYPLDNYSHVESGTEKKTFTPVMTENLYVVKNGNPVSAGGQIGIAVQADDYFNDNLSPCGIYSARLSVNKKEIFSYVFDRISFSQTRYINSLIDYSTYVNHRTRFAKMWLDPGNHLNIYKYDEQKGIITIDSGKTYTVEVVLADVSGNLSRCIIQLKGTPVKTNVPENTKGIVFSYNKENRMVAPGFDISTPKNSFYEDFTFNHKVNDSVPGYYSGIHHIHSTLVPIHKPVRIKIKTRNLTDSLASRAFIARIDKETPQYAGGKFTDGWIETSIQEFGRYAVMVDTKPPRIVPLTLKDNSLTDPWNIRFAIKDELSGIKSYSGFIDGQWALFEYDPRISSLQYKIDSTRISFGKRHSLVLTVRDKVNNTATYKASFWK